MLETSTTLETSTIDADNRRRSPTSIVDVVDPPASLEDSTGPVLGTTHNLLMQILRKSFF
jgi:hypothetical protein